VLECGAQATGGNYAFFSEVPGLEHVGFPIAEVHDDGSSVITKHAGTGGLVSVGTVTAQLLYEIGGHDYLGPDVSTRFDTIRLEDVGPDRVRVSGVAGLPPPPTTKVCVNYVGGFRNAVTFLLTGTDIEAKADLVQRQLAVVTDHVETEVRLERTDHEDPASNAEAVARLTVMVRDQDGNRVGRAFSSACIEIALASYPGCTVTAPPGDATPYGVYWPALVPNDVVQQVAVLPDGTRVEVKPVVGFPPPEARPEPPAAVRTGEGPTRRVPLGTLVGARSGDKGGDANIGVWTRSDAAYDWLLIELTAARLQELLPETQGLAVDRFVFRNLRAVNFVIHGLLGEGVSSSTRLDPQAKGLGEWLRSRHVDIPVALLDQADAGA
jgi:hypothetical protein